MDSELTYSDPEPINAALAVLLERSPLHESAMPLTGETWDTALRAVSLRFRILEADLSTARSALARTRAELSRLQDEVKNVRHMALHDSLTSLPNRGFFYQQVGRVLTAAAISGQAFAIFYLDLDGFKSLNDTYGHDIGDELLRIVAARLARSIRAGDMVSRVGGDEFACLVTGLSSRDRLQRLAHNLLESVAAPIAVGSLRLSITPSIGIAIYPTDGRETDALLKSADTAMYRAKRQRIGYTFV
jgi:diguanylate cyclase (GGDEF)-like protein